MSLSLSYLAVMVAAIIILLSLGLVKLDYYLTNIRQDSVIVAKLTCIALLIHQTKTRKISLSFTWPDQY